MENFLGWLLESHRVVGGVHSPRFASIGAALIILSVAYFYLRLRFICGKEAKVRLRISKELADFRTKTVLRPGEGFAGDKIEALEKIFIKEARYREAWERYRSQIVRLTSGEGVDTFYASESAAEAFNDSVLTDALINRSFYQAIPGIFTGLGLLLTFVAILVALMDVRIGDNKEVLGLDGLINGLSGKFVSSIAALFAASVYMILEKPIYHRLDVARGRLVDALDSLVPRLSGTQILARIHRNLEEQTDGFRLFNANLSNQLQQSFSTSIGPTLERMLDSIEGLNKFLRAAEENKQQAMAEQIKTLLQSIEQSMSETLKGMGSTFSDSLSGSARNEFGLVVDSLKSSAKLVSDLNLQFEGTQTAIKSLVEMAKQSTSDQMASGRRQVEDIASTLKQMMEQMEKTTGTSSTQMLNALTFATDALSNKVAELSDRMAQLVQDSTGQVSRTASQVIQEAGQWSEKSNERLATLLSRLDGHIDKTATLKGMLEASMNSLSEVLTQYRVVNKDVGEIASQMSLAAGSLQHVVSADASARRRTISRPAPWTAYGRRYGSRQTRP